MRESHASSRNTSNWSYTMLLALADENESPVLSIPKGWKYCTGKVGSMNSQKVVAAMETAAKSNQVIETDVYRETHALYHAIMEALYGVTRGQIQLADVLRTVGLLRLCAVHHTTGKRRRMGCCCIIWNDCAP